jgi:transposase InsO family protein
VVQVQQTLQVSERRACRVLKHCRATHQYVVQQPDDEAPLRTRIIELARAYGRYGYRRITALLHREGWAVNHKRVERIWRQATQASAPLVGGRFLHSETAGVSAPCLVL